MEDKTYRQKAKENYKNCQDATYEILYDLMEHGFLKEPYCALMRNVITKEQLTHQEEEKLDKLILEISTSLVIMADETLPQFDKITL